MYRIVGRYVHCQILTKCRPSIDQYWPQMSVFEGTKDTFFKKYISLKTKKKRLRQAWSVANMAWGPQDTPFQNSLFLSNKKAPVASLKGSKHGLGLPIHIKMLLILINNGLLIIIINWYTPLVLSISIILIPYWCPIDALSARPGRADRASIGHQYNWYWWYQ